MHSEEFKYEIKKQKQKPPVAIVNRWYTFGREKLSASATLSKAGLRESIKGTPRPRHGQQTSGALFQLFWCLFCWGWAVWRGGGGLSNTWDKWGVLGAGNYDRRVHGCLEVSSDSPLEWKMPAIESKGVCSLVHVWSIGRLFIILQSLGVSISLIRRGESLLRTVLISLN